MLRSYAWVYCRASLLRCAYYPLSRTSPQLFRSPTPHPPAASPAAVYWRHFASRFYWRPYLGDSNRVYPVARRINYFEHSHRWTQEDCALYWVGCAAGTAAWLLTALLAALDLRAARRNAAAAAAESIPLTAALLSGGDSSSSVTVRMAPSPVKATSVLGSRLLQVFWPQ